MPRSAAIVAHLSPCPVDRTMRSAARAAASAADAWAETIRGRGTPAQFLTNALANLGASVNRALNSVARATMADSAIFPARLRARRALHATSDQLSLRERSDEELIVAHRSGDTAALRVLVERYSSELHGFLTRLVGTRAGADDVFQEAFLQVHLSADAFDSERRFKPWLYTIAANKGRDFLRRQKRRAAVSLDAPVGPSGDASLIDLVSGSDDRPDSSLEAGDEAAIVKQVIDEMPGHFREILLLSYFQKMSYAQISDSLSIPLGTVKSRLHAAVASFASSWKLACARRGIPSQQPSTTDTDA
jgi:RNA polymerase sigma-70 factor (ECF subfamily)